MGNQALEHQAELYRAPAANRRILVPLDGSPEAEAILPHAERMARHCGAALELVRSYAPSPALVAATVAAAMPGTGPLLGTSSYLAAGREEADAYLEDVERRLRGAGVEVAHRRLEGPAGEAIVAEAQRWGADLIAMTTHGRGGFDRLVHGSVASYVAHHAPCPVLLVRPDTAPPATRPAYSERDGVI
jgi:nucleotide-binding universal stress UspA family protein